MLHVAAIAHTTPREATQRFLEVRSNTEALTAGLSEADCTVQSMADASPTKWHLGHTSWFFDEMLLGGAAARRTRHDEFRFLFNSYYESLGPRYPRALRGMITRPGLAAVREYRDAVTESVAAALAEAGSGPEQCAVVELGLAHEEQHQELILTDLLHLFSLNPTWPAYRSPPAAAQSVRRAPHLSWTPHAGERRSIGATDTAFAFDCECPRHDVLLAPYLLADRPVSNREWLEFMQDGGYEDERLWRSEGWAMAVQHGWRAPGYWLPTDGPEVRAMTLHGECVLDPDAPVSHVSWYEADAYASWAGARLPLEAEWECGAAEAETPAGIAPEGERLLPAYDDRAGPRQFLSDVWEWTASPFSPYPGFRPLPGPAGEYNGKFMVNQFVLRGASCLTPPGHSRTTYRNFFPPQARWQMTGVRLARDLV